MAKKKAKAKKKGNPGRGGKQPGAGKPKKVITPAQMRKAEGYAFDGCQNGTIATLMGWADAFISERNDIRKRLTKKRAERKVWLRQTQDQHAEGGNGAAMSIFLGKNELGQTDKTEVEIDASEKFQGFMDWLIGRNGDDTKD